MSSFSTNNGNTDGTTNGTTNGNSTNTTIAGAVIVETPKKRVCVFGSSSKKTPQKYLDVAFRLGARLGEQDLVCVNGAGNFGCMGAVSRGTRSTAGRVIGVIHESFVVDNQEDRDIDERIVSYGPDLNERKQLLMDNGDAIIVLPGGVGTFDEIWDVASAKSLGMKNLKGKPMVLLNSDGFYDGFILQLQRAFDDGLLYFPPEAYFGVAATPEEAVQYCQDQWLAQCNPTSDEGMGDRITKRPDHAA